MIGKVLDGMILVRQDDPEEVTEGGIIIPDTAKEKPKQGVIVVSGKPLKRKQMDVGDRVLFADHAGTVINLDDKELDLQGEFVLLKQDQVLFIKELQEED